MGRIRRIQLNFGALLRSERGMAMPVVLTVMVIGLGFSAATIVASVNALSGATVDQDSKSALAIADAGAQRALVTYNKIDTTDPLPCVVKTGSGSGASYNKNTIPSGSTPWCGGVGGASDPDAKVGNGYFTYWVKPCLFGVSGTGCQPGPGAWSKVRQVKIVSQGYQDGVMRRVSVVATGIIGSLGNASNSMKVVGLNGITTDGSSDIDVDLGTNGDVTMLASSSVCGNIQVGTGHQVVNPSHQCTGYNVTYGNLTLSPVDITAVNASNSNSRLTNINQPGQDTKTGSGFSWNPTTRVLTLTGNTTVTLGGFSYSLCKLDISGNSQLIMAAGANAKIYIDSPEACGQASPANQVSVTGSSTILSTGWDPSQNSYDLPAIYMVGSTSRTTTAVFTGNSKLDNQFALYAPRTDVTLWGNTTYVGSAAGKTLSIGGSAHMVSDPNVPPVGAGGSTYIVYTQNSYVECGPSGATYDANC
jgi:hypothetical protein